MSDLAVAIAVLVGGGILLLTVGVRFTRIVDTLADRTQIGEAVAGAVLLGAATSIPGLITTVTGAAEGDAGFAVSNAVGGIAAQTTFLVLADLIYRNSNLEHAAASLPNLLQGGILLALLGVTLMATAGPDVEVLGVHPASVALVVAYVYGLNLVRRARMRPMWRPRETEATVVDDDDPDELSSSTRSLWVQFAVGAAIVGAAGYFIGRSGIVVARESGLSGSVVGAVFTAVITSLPELVTVLAAVRIGALTLAVSNIVGGNTFDVLFIAAADVAFREGSVYGAAGQQAVYMLSLAVVLTAMLVGGLLYRDRRYIGFEGVAILATYAVGIIGLVAI